LPQKKNSAGNDPGTGDILGSTEILRGIGNSTLKAIAAAAMQKMVEEGKFREDLFYRLNVIKIVLPPLRERPEDIALLATHFIEKFSRNKEPFKQLSPQATEVLLNYRWPGNIRELENAIERALKLHRAALQNPLATMAALGGFEIAAMAGVCLSGAALNVPVVVDGFIATAAAVAAERMSPGLFAHQFFGHRSIEGGHALVLEKLGVRPIVDLGMRLGEGTGAALAMSVIESALALFHEMATFESAGVSKKLE